MAETLGNNGARGSESQKVSNQGAVKDSATTRASARGLINTSSSASSHGVLDATKRYSQSLSQGAVGATNKVNRVVNAVGQVDGREADPTVGGIVDVGGQVIQNGGKVVEKTANVTKKGGRAVGRVAGVGGKASKTMAGGAKGGRTIKNNKVSKGAKKVGRGAKKVGSNVKAAGNKGLDALENLDEQGYITGMIEGSRASAYMTKKGVKVTRKGAKAAVKTAKGTYRTAKRTVRGARRLGRATRNGARRAARLAKRGAQIARKAGRLIVRGAKAAGRVVVKAAQATARGIAALIKAIAAFIAAGGWIILLVILGIVILVLIVGAIFSVFAQQNDTGSLTGREKEVAAKLMECGYDKRHTAGIMGNLLVESTSSLDFGAYQGGGSYEDLPGDLWTNSWGYGACQWTCGRKQNVCQSMHDRGKLTSDDEQLAWMRDEAGGGAWYSGNPGAYGVNPMSYEQWIDDSQDGVDYLAMGWAAYYERCASDEAGHLDKRKSEAQRIFTALNTQGGDGTIVGEAMAIANDDSHGYSQANRTLNPDVDCSSFVFYSLQHAGIPLDGYPFSTSDMGGRLKAVGFQEMGYQGLGACVPGDVLMNSGHTEIYIGNNQSVGAHWDHGHPEAGDQTGTEVSVGSADQGWSLVYRKG